MFTALLINMTTLYREGANVGADSYRLKLLRFN